MMDALSGIERLSLVTPLGVRFRDEVSGEVVGEGLYVTAYPQNNPALRVQAVVNSVGIYTLRNVPGLRNFEHGAGDADFWRTLPPKRSFIVLISHYPAPVDLVLGYPSLTHPNMSLAKQTWPVQFQAAYAPSHPVPLIP